jgi:large subunit ribosomal protein L28
MLSIASTTIRNTAIRSANRRLTAICQHLPVGAASTTINSAAVIAIQARFRSNRSRRGLYDGKDVRTGNKVSHSERKTKRKFKPNVFIKRVYSEILDEMVRFHLTTAALRSIDKAGGLDNYLLKSKHITEGEGLAAKKRVVARMKELEEEKARESAQNESTGSEA